MRKMAHIEVIHSISPIDGADAIELACVLGWQCVVKKGEFQVGQLVVYCEIDSWVPLTTAPFLQKGEKIREFNGVPGNRLKTIKLRGALSQGLILPCTSDMPNEEGSDVSEILSIQKWEAPENPQLAGTQKGNFPAQFPKTDQERIQNISDRTWAIWQEKNYSFEVTEKLEGSSMTCYLLDGVFGVCSRNIDLKETEDNTFWKVARAKDIEAKMRKASEQFGLTDWCIQGELIGPGIQGNIYGLTEHMFYVFEIVKAGGTKLNADDRTAICNAVTFFQAPLKGYKVSLKSQTKQSLLKKANDLSQLKDVLQEGLVFKCIEDPSISFKAVSDEYLLKSKN